LAIQPSPSCSVSNLPIPYLYPSDIDNSYMLAKLSSCISALLIFGLLLLSLTSSAQFSVDVITDTPDANPGDGICADAGGNCSLRAAVMESNAFAGDNDIFLPIGEYVFSIAGANEDASATGDLDITGNLVITGEDTRQTIVNAFSLDRAFDISAGIAVSIQNLEIEGGAIVAANGGAIRNLGNLSLIEVGISNSSCEGDGTGMNGGGYGGGIYNAGALDLSQVTIQFCLALGGAGGNGVAPGGGSGGGAGPGLGGAIYNDQTASCTLVNSTFSNNIARGGKGGNGTFHQGSGITASPGGVGGGFGGNSGPANGPGAPGNWGGGGGGGGSISGAGAAGGFGGGGGGGGASSWGGNAGTPGAAGLYGGGGGQGCCSAGSGGGGGAGLGGGIFNRSADIEITNCTFAFNQAIGGLGGNGWFSGPGAPGSGKGGAIFNLTGNSSINNSLFAENSGSTDSPSLFGTFDSNSGHNLIQNSDAGMILIGNTANNLLNVDPLILPLANNGGNTDTHLLEACNPTSPAIDAGNDAFASALDQIGQTRINSSEIGSVEIVAATVNLLPADTTLCFGESILLDVTSAGSTYAWNNASTDPTLLVDSEGLYSVVISQAGCDYYDEINVEYNPLENIDLGADQNICPGAILILDASYPGATYEWQDGSDLATFELSEDGTYSVIVTLDDCSTDDSISIAFVDDPGLDLGADVAICAGETIDLSTDIIADSYAWSTGDDEASITVSETGDYTLDIEIATCIFSSSVYVEVSPVPDFSLGADTEFCDGESTELDVSSELGTYEWQDGSMNGMFLVEETGTYSVTITLDNCSASDEVEITFNPSPIFDLGDDISLCEGESAELSTNVAADVYDWNTGADEASIEVSNSGIYSLELTVNNCSYTSELEVTVNASPSFSLGDDMELCEGENTLLDLSSEAGTYLWQDGSTADSFLVDESGIYSVTVTLNNCTGTDEIEIIFNPIPEFDLGDDGTVCYSSGFQLEVLSDVSFTSVAWSNGQTGSLITPLISANYQATAFADGCIYTDDINIEIIEALDFDLGPDRIVCEGVSLGLNPDLENFPHPVSYIWSDDSTQPTLDVTRTGSYELTAISECDIVSDEVYVYFEQCGCFVYVPNAFSPDNDGTNDYFSVQSECDFESFSLKIFNRDGQLVFESDNPNQVWDGSHIQGDYYVQNGVYVWMIEYTTTTLEGLATEELRGHVVALR